ncbi:hypothetical protein H1R20_g6371, partial [Candolleomyces eurysporus]
MLDAATFMEMLNSRTTARDYDCGVNKGKFAVLEEVRLFGYDDVKLHSDLKLTEPREDDSNQAIMNKLAGKFESTLDKKWSQFRHSDMGHATDSVNIRLHMELDRELREMENLDLEKYDTQVLVRRNVPYLLREIGEFEPGTIPVTTSSSSGGWKNQQAQGPAAMASNITALCLNVFTSILTLLSTYYTLHPHAYPLLKNLFENDRWKKLCGYVSGAAGGGSMANDIILVTLRLLDVIVERWDAKKVLEGFIWESKSLSKLLQMRRENSSTFNPLVKPDIRTAYTLFLLSFVLPSTSTSTSSSNSQTKTAFLQQHSLHFTAIFKNLHQDQPTLIRRVLEVCWEGVWCDVRVNRSLKVSVFTGSGAGAVLQNLLKLYERTTPETEDDGDYTVADLVHHFLLAICTRPGVGLCFKDRGWYPRDVSGGDSLFNEDEDDGASSKLKQPKLHNPTLLNLLKQLKPTDDPRQHELALKILSACPELVSPYLPTSGLTLDPPRLSSKWVANVSFLGSVIGGEVPESTFYMAGGSQYRPTPPPLTTIVNNIAPGGGASQLNMRNVFTKGLQFVRSDAGAKDKAAKSEAGAGNTGNLVQHTTALVLIRCLEKMGRVREAMEGVSKALGEGADDLFVWGLDEGANADDEEDDLGPSYRKESKEGLWARRQKEVVKEVRKRVPEFQVVLAFCTAHLKTSTTTTTSADVQQEESEGEQIKKALLAECAMRLLWMYQKALPEVVEEARFDAGKVLVGFDVTLGLSDGDDESGQQGEGDEEEEEEDENVAEEEKEGKDEAKGDYSEAEDQEGDGKDRYQSQPRQEVSAPTRLHRLTQLHILRFLRASPTFSFTAQSPTFPGHTHLYSLLDGIVKLGGISIHPDQDDQDNGIYVELRRLVQHVLGKSVLFQWGKAVGGIAEDALEDGGGEVVAWLASLPVGLRRVRKVKRLVDVSNYNDGSDGSMDEGDERKEKNEDNIVTVYPESLDGTTLTDERLSVVAFLEDCVLRCLKTPYKYIEELESLAGDAAGEGRDVDSGASLPSPLLITLVEQLEAKLISQGGSKGSSAVLLTPSDVLAIASYLRALLFSLVGMLDVAISSATEHEVKMIVMQKILDRLDTLFAGDVWEKAFGAEPHALVRGAAVRELHIARTCLALDNWGDKDRNEVEDEDIDDFLDLIEALEIPSPVERRLTIYELIDWLRLLGSRLTQAQVVRLWEAVTELWPTGLGEVLKYLDAPSVKDRNDGISVWEALLKSGGAGVGKDSDMDVDQDSAEHVDDGDGEEKAQFDPSSLPFEYLLSQALPKNLSNSKCQEILAESALNYLTRPFDSSMAPAPLDTLDLKFIIRHILHRLSAFLSIEQVDASKNLLAILASVLSQVRTLDPIALDSGKATVVASLKGLMISTAVAEKDVRQGLLRVQEAILDPTSPADVALVAEIASFWVDILKQHLASDRAGRMLAVDAEYAGWWIRFVHPGVVLGLVRDAMQNQEGSQEVLGLCLRALNEASRHSKAHGQLTSDTQDLALLLQLHSTLSYSDAREGAEGLRREELKTVEDLIAISLESNGVPVGLGGGRELRSTRTSPSLSISIEEAEKRWACGIGGASVPELDIASVAKSLLSQTLEDWSDATENIVRSFFYKGQDPAGLLEKAVIQWAVNRDGSDGNDRVIGVLHAFLDCVLHRGPATSASSLDSPEVVCKIFELLLEHLINPGQRTNQANEGLQFLWKSMCRNEGKTMETCFTSLEQCLKALKKSIVSSSGSPSRLSPDLINISRWMIDYFSADEFSHAYLSRAQSIDSDVVELSIQWLIRRLGEEDGLELDEETRVVCAELGSLLKREGVSCKSGSLETLMGVVIQSDYHLSQPPCLDVLETGLAKADLKPLIVNRHLQGIVQHQHFFKLCAPSPFSSSNISLLKIRDSIISLLHNLFHLHPSNTCQVSHIEPLTKVYGGTLSSSDRRLLSIFQLFERQRKLSVRAVVGRWMPPSSSLATGSGESVGLEALQNLDGISLLRTALAFPMRMRIDVPTDFDKSTVYENQLYDPLFLLLLLQHVLFNGPPTSAISWIELFRSNVPGLALRALSARDGKLREIGMGCIVAVWTLMQNADLQERDHVLYLLGLLKNAVVPPPANSNSKDAQMDPGAEDGEDQARFPPRLPSYTTLLLFHALRGIFNPSTFMYPLMSRFLLQRAELDITDVPMLYNMLYSSDQDDWKKERGWMLRFLADGALTGSGVSDWRLLKRRHVWDLVASMYSSAAPTSSALATNATMTDVAAIGAGAGGDRAFKLSILDFLANLTRHRGPTMSLILKSGLLAWIEVQVLGPDRHASFGLEWLRILENVMVVVDVRKMDGSALKGQWVKSVARCVDGILKEAIGTPLVLVNILPLSVRLIARLSRIESIGTQSLGSLIHQALLVLKAFESNVKHRPGSRTPPLLDEIVPPPQHSSHSLHDKLLALLNHWGGLEYFDEQAAGLEGSGWSGR